VGRRVAIVQVRYTTKALHNLHAGRFLRYFTILKKYSYIAPSPLFNVMLLLATAGAFICRTLTIFKRADTVLWAVRAITFL
jgi:hypothetical protein